MRWCGVRMGRRRELMRLLTEHRRLDWSRHVRTEAMGTGRLFHPGPGHMFGVLVCEDSEGVETVLRGFSGQHLRLWHVPGWVGFAPPLRPSPDSPRSGEISTKVGADSALRTMLCCKGGLTTPKSRSWGLITLLSDIVKWCLSISTPTNVIWRRKPPV